MKTYRITINYDDSDTQEFSVGLTDVEKVEFEAYMRVIREDSAIRGWYMSEITVSEFDAIKAVIDQHLNDKHADLVRKFGWKVAGGSL